MKLKTINKLQLCDLLKNKPNQRLTNKEYYTCSIEQNGTIDKTKGDDLIMIDDGKCPFCGSGNDNPIHFRISSAFTNRILSDIILEQTQEKKKNLLLLYLMVKIHLVYRQ